ncbi:MAG: DinB family protein [Planctomycetota bacterium]|jgi:uncharacterized damage-inducible protein DinB
MNEVLLETFRYSAWATKTLIAACRDLSVEQLERPARGFGSILATLHHVVLSDAGYAVTLGASCPAWVNGGDETDDLDRLAARVDETARLWEQLLAEPIDAERLLLLDGGTYECHAAVVVAQALHHADAHREQVRAGLRDLELQPPDVQPWEYALATGRAHWRRAKT